MRAHRRYLGPDFKEQQKSGHDLALVKTVAFGISARMYLMRQLYSPGRYRGGPLFGSQNGAVISIEYAASLGYLWRYGTGSDQEDCLETDERYLLGWSDCLELVRNGHTDWIGNWIASPNSELGDPIEDLLWFRRGHKQGLFDGSNLLVMIGWDDGAMTGRAYRSSNGTPQQISCLLK